MIDTDSTRTPPRRPNLWLVAVAYPLLAHAAVLSGNPLITVAAVGVLTALILGPALARRSLAAWLMLAIVGFVLIRFANSTAIELTLYAPPVLIMAFMAWVFGHTLRRGEVPLIERIVRAFHDPAENLDPAIFRYARRLTWLWAILLGALAVVNLVLALVATPNGLLLALGIDPPVTVPQRIWSLFANLLNYVVIGGFFVTEYVVRRRRFPQQEYSGIVDFTQRLIRLGPSLRMIAGGSHQPSAGPTQSTGPEA
jgi:uncharacterized membrane protein